MLSLSRASRFALILSMSLGYLAVRAEHAYADDEEEEDDGGDDGDDGGDDGGDSGEEEEEEQPDEDQPKVTDGGLFTMKTYPQRETQRPLTMTQKIGQVRLGVGTDLSAKGAFDSFGVSLEGVYGFKDNFSLIGGFTSAYNMKQFGVYAGFEGSLYYDLIDIRVAANLHRTAIPHYCGEMNPETMEECEDPTMPGMVQTLQPDGTFDAGGTKFSIELGFPFRYAIRPEFALVALQTLMSIDFNSIKDGYAIFEEGATERTLVRNSATPDLIPSVGIATNPIAALSLTIFAQLRVIDFDTAAGSFQVPVTGRIQFSPNQKLDIGLEFTLLNVKPPEGQGPADNRYLSLFGQFRIGK